MSTTTYIFLEIQEKYRYFLVEKNTLSRAMICSLGEQILSFKNSTLFEKASNAGKATFSLQKLSSYAKWWQNCLVVSVHLNATSKDLDHTSGAT